MKLRDQTCMKWRWKFGSVANGFSFARCSRWTVHLSPAIEKKLDLWPVWPDVEIKSNPSFSIRSLKSRHCSFYFKGMYFKVAQIVNINWETLVKNVSPKTAWNQYYKRYVINVIIIHNSTIKTFLSLLIEMCLKHSRIRCLVSLWPILLTLVNYDSRVVLARQLLILWL